jgi:hypothetical protein
MSAFSVVSKKGSKKGSKPGSNSCKIFLEPMLPVADSCRPPFEDVLNTLWGAKVVGFFVGDVQGVDPVVFADIANTTGSTVRPNKSHWRINTKKIRRAKKRVDSIKIESKTVETVLERLRTKYGSWANGTGIKTTKELYFFHGKCGGGHGRKTTHYEVGSDFLGQIPKWNWVFYQGDRRVEIPFAWK